MYTELKLVKVVNKILTFVKKKLKLFVRQIQNQTPPDKKNFGNFGANLGSTNKHQTFKIKIKNNK